jgi:hypothetical protein
MPNHRELAIPDATIETCKMHFSALVALAESVIKLRRARDMVLMAHGSTTAAASVHVLAGAAHSLVLEMGAELKATGEASDDAEVRAWVALLQDRLQHESRATVPPDDKAPQ